MIAADQMLVLFFALCGMGAAFAVAFPDRRVPHVVAVGGALAALALLAASGRILLDGRPVAIALGQMPLLGPMLLRIDRLSALFLVLVALVYFPVSIFSAGYLQRYLGRGGLRAFGALYHLLAASIVLCLAAADVLTFLLAWEAMSVLCYLLVNHEQEREETARAAFLMLAMGEAGTVAAALGLLVLAGASGALDFASLRSAAGGIGDFQRWVVFLLCFLGFGVKAGLVPVSSWLPRAHPAAPGNVSALLSGVILNLGIYGIVRVNVDLLPPVHVGQGLIVLAVGSISALIGILYATTENDLKKMLAHSSIENMGIITAGIGAGLVFHASGHAVLAGVATVAALYHMTNHSLYKALLFLGASAVDAQAGGRDMDRLGGLIRRMPWTALFFLAGALSIAALPPFNGFVSEWLTLQTLLRSALLSSPAMKIVFALCGACLALTAALAVTCFVKAFAMSFLGVARSEEAGRATEVRRSLTLPMGILAVSCLLLGILPTYVIPVLGRVATGGGDTAAEALVPPFYRGSPGHDDLLPAFVAEFHDLGAQVGQDVLPGRGLVVLHRGTERNPVVFAMSTSYMVVVLVLLLGGSFLVVWLLTRRRRVVRGAVWAGGLRRLRPGMTYTATGFSNPVRVIFATIFRPSSEEKSREMVAEHFRSAIHADRKEVHVVDRSFVRPVVRAANGLAAALGRVHSGRVNTYAAFVLMCLVLFLLIPALF